MRLFKFLRKFFFKPSFDIKIFSKKNLFEILKIVNKVGFSRFTVNEISFDLPDFKKVIIIAPHPDDEVIGAGGTIIKLIKKKCNVKIIYMTSGRLNEKEIREQELKRVCNKLGVKHYIIGGVANQKLFGSKIIAQIIEDFKPNVILMPFILDDNDDHRKTHLQFKAALKILPKANYKRKITVWSYQIYGPLIVNKVIDISDIISRKEALIKNYKSQFRSRDWAHYTSGMNAWNSRFLNKKKTKAWAECFFVQSIIEYENFFKDIFTNQSD